MGSTTVSAEAEHTPKDLALSKQRFPEITEIERVEAPTRVAFEENIARCRKPVILTGVASKWKAYADWDVDYLDRRAREVMSISGLRVRKWGARLTGRGRPEPEKVRVYS